MAVGPTRITAHRGHSTRTPVPPDQLVVYPVAVDAEPPRIAVESIVDEATTSLAVLTIAEAAGLAAGLLATVDTAWTGARRQDG